jgi:hypothetical protein
MQRTPRHFDLKASFKFFATLLTLATSISCAPGAAASQQSSVWPTSTTTDSGARVTLAVPALWEASQHDRAAWSQDAAKVINEKCEAMIEGPKDIANFCPRYSQLNRQQKINVWVYLISAITKFESTFDPTSRMKEPGLGIDAITRAHVYSEGLLQLSYQDQQGYPFCKVFDWEADRHLAVKDPRKTILSPTLNLECGIQILNKQIERKDRLAIESGAYWSTLKPSGRKFGIIRALVRGMSLCH